MGSRKISFEPAAIFLVSNIVMYVSLCGPHSFETFTLAPTAIDCVVPTAGSAPLWRNWYFSHQVGSFELAPRAGRARASPSSEAR